ncbi:MAG: hypothetical protein M0D57_16650 [Sphingobacteriales bacterium JAD_PAG50586_3]|nr:MAG: hypothetical protein M0D57_16650 [Sphingobacteriales bacterium JAD_PAG50586_3]
MKKLYMVLPVMAFVFLSACKKDSNDDEQRTVEYSIECPNCYVIYYDANGEQVILQDQNSSWKQTIDAKPGAIVLLAAQNSSSSPAAVTGTIKLNGTVLAEQTTYCPISGTVLVTDTLP